MSGLGTSWFNWFGNVITGNSGCDEKTRAIKLEREAKELLLEKEALQKILKGLENAQASGEFNALINRSVKLKKEIELLKVEKNKLIISANDIGLDVSKIATLEKVEALGICSEQKNREENAIKSRDKVVDEIGVIRGKIDYYKNLHENTKTRTINTLKDLLLNKNRLFKEIRALKERISSYVNSKEYDEFLKSTEDKNKNKHNSLNLKAIKEKENVILVSSLMLLGLIVIVNNAKK